MRCPKCGYISFDHLDKCRKCNKNIETISAGLFGTTYNLKAPTFLKMDREQRKDQSAEMEFSDEQSFIDDDDYVDDELAILVEDEDSEETGEINFAGDKPAEMAFSDAEEQDDGEIEIDFSQFEETDEQSNLFDEEEDEEEQEQTKRDPLKIDIPAALSDMSDLAPPAKNIANDAEISGATADLDFSNVNLDDLNFDLGLDGLDDNETKAQVVSEKNVLSLDELDFADTLAESDRDSAGKNEGMDLDLDLDFDLDLGGLSIHKDV